MRILRIDYKCNIDDGLKWSSLPAVVVVVVVAAVVVVVVAEEIKYI